MLSCLMCQKPTAKRLDGVSAKALVIYFRCDACGAIWHTSKDDPFGPVQIVGTGHTPPSSELSDRTKNDQSTPSDALPERQYLKAEEQRLRNIAAQLERELDQLKGSIDARALRTHAERRTAYLQDLNRYLDRAWHFQSQFGPI